MGRASRLAVPGRWTSAVGKRGIGLTYSFDALNDTQIPVSAVAQCSECLLIPWTVVRGDRLRDTLKLNDHDALIQPALVYPSRQTARQEAPARRLQCRGS